ncbi:MAG: membrane protein insertion efficiency factor YidD [Verrucomicrobia bacterium]|nr:membrane protein insertion efficiency factor YidD [Verrucomicrobiota bacterium]
MNPAQHFLVLLVRLYRWTLSPLLPLVFGPSAHCRFTPSCSAYALEAVRLHGAAKGTLLSAHRLCRCQPWGGGGHDPVPGKNAECRMPNGEPAPAATHVSSFVIRHS